MKINGRPTIFYQQKLFEVFLKQFLGKRLSLLQGNLRLSQAPCSSILHFNSTLQFFSNRLLNLPQGFSFEIYQAENGWEDAYPRLQGFKEVSETTNFKSKMILSDTVCFHICEGCLLTHNYLTWSIFSPVNTWCISNWKMLIILSMPWRRKQLNWVRRKASGKKIFPESSWKHFSPWFPLKFLKHMPWFIC